jgi:murein DD-endopeptidase MepM/ murein hydrolase activator NlpD
MRALPWIVGGGALAYFWMRGKRFSVHAPSAPPPDALAGRWVWPVPTYQGRRPVISDGFDSPRPGLPRHGGVDLMFARQSSDPFKPGTPNGSKLFVMPDDLPAIAASDGVVWSATQTPQGFAVVIDHGPRKVATFYTHLEKLLVAPASPGKNGQQVRAGQPIGIIGASPRDSEHLKHLHFEIWLGGPSDRIDPAPVMRSWETVTDPTALVARNGALVYRAIGASGERYPAWIRELDGKAGVYVIRDADSHEILYVGSSAGRLYDTLTRHFQRVRHEAQEDPMT